MQAPHAKARYYASRKTKFVVIERDGIRYEISVSGKAEARRIAAEYGAVCWNF